MYLGVNIYKDDRKQNDINNRINNSNAEKKDPEVNIWAQ